MNKISLISRLYIWSVIFEPLLFFTLWHRSVIGIGGNISRILQFIVILALISRCFIKSNRLQIINFAYPFYSKYGIYLGITVIAGLVGFASGSYEVPVTYVTYQSYFSSILNSPVIRPIFEYVITVYYFIYFVVLPSHVLNTERALLYFFSAFRITFFISLVVGFLDYAVFYVGVELIPRHIDDWVHVADRFHGLAGEPRQAFIYLFFGIAILYCEAYLKGRSFNRLWLITVIVAAILTDSASGFLGIIFFLGLLFLYSLPRLKHFVNPVKLLGIFIIVSFFLSGSTFVSERSSMYLKASNGLWELLESSNDLPIILHWQRMNIYPLYDLTVKARNFDVIPILIGSGLGSASAINNRYSPSIAGLTNPDSQLVRLLFESGIIGTFFFIISFIYPVEQLTKNFAPKNRRTFIILTFLLIGCFMAHRSSAPYIFLGIFLAQYFTMQYRHNKPII